MTTTTLRAAIVAELDDDGSSYELPDGRTIRLRIMADDVPPMDQWSEDCYGAVAWVRAYRGDADWHRYGTSWVYSGQDAPRPDGFDGAARKLSLRDGSVWWQPPADVTGDDLTRLRRSVLDLMEYGFSGVVLEVTSGTDAYGRPIVTDVASLWGIDSLENGYLADVVGELLGELATLEGDE